MEINHTEIDVRYAETDQMGIVHHSNYLIWFEIGRTNFIKQIGFNYADMEARGILSPIIDVQLSYKNPAKYGETVIIETWLKTYDGIRTTYEYRITNQKEDLLVTGSTIHVVVKKDNFKPILLRKTYPEWHQTYKNLIKEEE
ncbi:MAG TPA: thioesterase family protein [Pseudogracilibacillus sp.]|nr:thioesterase family protein [Pseudogracilibacillus sp.]